MPEGRAGLRVWDRLVLLVAWTVTCGFVYLLGVSVGRGTQDLHARPEERVVRLPVNTPAPAAGAPAGPADEVTFYEKLVTADRTHDRVVEPKAGPAAAPPEPAAKAKTPPPSSVANGLMAAARAVGALGLPGASGTAAAKPSPPSGTVATTPKPSAGAAPKATAAVPVKVAATTPRIAAAPPKSPAAATPKPTTGAIASAVVAPDAAPKPVPVRTVPPAAARPEAAATANAKPPADPAAPPKKTWMVTASASPDRYEAEALVHQLKSKGYAAAMVQTAKNGVAQYRVRVGRYGSSTEATDAARKLQREGLQGATPASTD